MKSKIYSFYTYFVSLIKLLIAIVILGLISIFSLQKLFITSYLPTSELFAVNAETYYVVDETIEAILPTSTPIPTPLPRKKPDMASISQQIPQAQNVSVSVAGGGMENEIIQLINQKRAADGLSILSQSGALTQAARRHSRDNSARTSVSDCSHSGSDGSDFVRRAAEAGIGAYGETIGCGHGSAQSVVDAWLNSPPHKAILTNGSITVIGVGWAQDKHSAQTALVGF